MFYDFENKFTNDPMILPGQLGPATVTDSGTGEKLSNVLISETRCGLIVRLKTEGDSEKIVEYRNHIVEF